MRHTFAGFNLLDTYPLSSKHKGSSSKSQPRRVHHGQDETFSSRFCRFIHSYRLCDLLAQRFCTKYCDAQQTENCLSNNIFYFISRQNYELLGALHLPWLCVVRPRRQVRQSLIEEPRSRDSGEPVKLKVPRAPS